MRAPRQGDVCARHTQSRESAGDWGRILVDVGASCVLRAQVVQRKEAGAILGTITRHNCSNICDEFGPMVEAGLGREDEVAD
jgi:hypothetical protein